MSASNKYILPASIGKRQDENVRGLRLLRNIFSFVVLRDKLRQFWLYVYHFSHSVNKYCELAKRRKWWNETHSQNSNNWKLEFSLLSLPSCVVTNDIVSCRSNCLLQLVVFMATLPTAVLNIHDNNDKIVTLPHLHESLTCSLDRERRHRSPKTCNPGRQEILPRGEIANRLRGRRLVRSNRKTRRLQKSWYVCQGI